MREWEERLARNEALFRELNERMKEISQSLAPGETIPALEIFCECGQADCIEKLVVPFSEYEAVRSRPEHFLVATGHDTPEVETIFAQRDGYSIVEKHEEEAGIARQTDPRR
jgi:hypothetical protein